MFCGNFRDTIVQIAPKETLGKQFYIPPLNLSTEVVAVKINAIMSEGNTVIKVKGSYDQCDTVNHTGDELTLDLSENTVTCYDILS